MKKRHMFVICAYGHSPYLEECIQSLTAQSMKSEIMIATSTPNDYIAGLAEKYDLPLKINPIGGKGIAADWNFAFDACDADYVTIAHQDDIYLPEFLRETMDALDKHKDPIIAFTDYGELRGAEIVLAKQSKLLRIKKIMLLPLRKNIFHNSRWIRRRILSIGDAICCPSVTYVKGKTGFSPFSVKYKCDLDWDIMERLSRLKGDFVYIHKPLMYHRIHAESATTAMIGKDKGRSVEDLDLFMRFWPKPIAERFNHLYSRSQDSNTL